MKDFSCNIKWKDTGDTEAVTIRVDPNYDCDNPPPDDDSIFFYCSNEEELNSLKSSDNGEDFIVLSIG